MKKILFVLFLIFLLVVVSSCEKSTPFDYEEEYHLLENKYDAACTRIENMLESIGSLEDDIATLYCFFGNEETISNAEKAFDHLRSVLENIK